MVNSKMATKKTNTTTDEVEQYKQRVMELERQGYVPMPLQETLGGAYDPTDASWQGIINAHFSASCDPCNPCNRSSSNVGSLVTSSGYEMNVTGKDKKQHTIIAWGSDNQLPNHVALWSKLLPYTATSLDHRAELAAGLCVQPKFRFFDNSGGTVKAETMDYAAGGEWLRLKMRECALAIAKVSGDQLAANNGQPDANNASVQGAKKANSDVEAMNDLVTDMLMEDYKRYEEAYEVWKKTNKEITEFMERSNLPLLYLKWMQEMTMLGVAMPEVELSQDANVKSSAQWKPKVVGLSHRPIMACRLAKREADGHIKEVVISNYWLSERQPEDYDLDYKSLPLLDEQHPQHDMQSRLRDWRIKNPKVGHRERPTRWLMPCFYPSVGQNYYPFMSWWSIFEGDIYPYLATIISDRAIRKRNSNSVGRIVYIHTEYLDKINRETDAKKRVANADKLRDEIFRQTTQFLNDKSKNGSTMLSFTFPNMKGEQTKAIEIVDVPFAANQQTDKDMELMEVASIVYFALRVHPELIGAVPGSQASKGGTYMREMLLIDEVTSASILQQMMNRTMMVVQGVNEWDKEHLVWETPQKTLTTLDRNASGVTEQTL